MKAGCVTVLALVLGFVPLTADAQHRYTSEALVGIDKVPFVVRDLEAAKDVWRRLGFLVKPGKLRANGSEFAQVKFADGSGIELVTASAANDEQATRYRELLAEAEGPAGLSFHARDLGAFRTALQGSPFEYGTVSRRFGVPSLAYLEIAQDSREPNDVSWLKHRNGATALSRVWIAASRREGRDLGRMLEAVGAEITTAKIYAPEATQATVATVGNGEVLILPEDAQLNPGRQVIGVTFEVESIAALSSRLMSFGIPFADGGALNSSVIVSPEITQGMWVEFRE